MAEKAKKKVAVRFCDRCMEVERSPGGAVGGAIKGLTGAMMRPRDATNRVVRTATGAAEAEIGVAAHVRTTSAIPAAANGSNPRDRGVSMAWIKPAENFEDRSHWVPDHSRDNCKLCKSTFGMFLWRHHCRKCGEVRPCGSGNSFSIP